MQPRTLKRVNKKSSNFKAAKKAAFFMEKIHKTKRYKAIGLVILTLIVILSGCYTPEKATKQADKALSKYPDKIAPKFREVFPCEVMKIDTVHDWQNSTVYVDCPPQPEKQTDTLYIPSKPIRVPATVKVERITITKTIKDSAEIFALKDTIADLKNKVFTYKTKYENCEKLRAEESERYKSPLYLLLALILSVLANFFQLRKSKASAKTK
jgi:hypothetical protein